MSHFADTIVTVICSVFASSGLWTFITAAINSRRNKNNSESKRIELIEKMTRGLAHAKIVDVGEQYLEDKHISLDDLDDFNHYLYFPYSAMGGNGYAKKIAEEVNKLPIDIVKQRKRTNV